MEAITTNTTANATVASHMTALGKAALSLDAGSIFVLAATLSVFVLPLFIIFPPFPPRKSDALNETHNKLGLDPAKSNLLPHKADHNAANTTEPTAKIKSLFVYPVKSCKGIELARAKVVSTGLDFDRLFTFAQLKSPFPISTTTEAPTANKQQQQQQPYWEFITQRQFPLLATVQVELWEPSLTKIAGFRDLAAGASHEVFLLLRFPDPSASAWAHFAAMCTRGSARARAEIEILLPVAVPDADECERKGYVREPVRVWGSNPPALNLGSEIPGALARYLGVSNKLALFRVDPEALREAGANAPPREEVGYQPVVGFADSYPVHVMNLASVRDLEEKVAKDRDLVELTPRRFRANIFGESGFVSTPNSDNLLSRLRGNYKC